MLSRAGAIAAVWIGVTGWVGIAAPALSQPLPAALEAALPAAELTDNRENWRFAITVTTDEGVMQGRFDGAAAEDARWSLISPAEDELDGTLLEIWEDMRTPDDDREDDGGLLFKREDFEFVPGSVSVISETAEAYRYSFAPQMDEGDAAAFADYVQGEVIVRADQPEIQQIRIFATESFKPNVAIRVNEFEMIQEFETLEGMDAPVMTGMRQSLSGSMAFQRFEQSVEIRFEDIEHIAR